MTSERPQNALLECPRCGAAIQETGDSIECPYCHSRLVLRGAQKPSAAPRQDLTAEELVPFDLPDPQAGVLLMSMRVPSGWGWQGGALWGSNPAQPARVHFRVGNPDGVEALEWFPTDHFAWTTDPMIQRMTARGGDYYGVEFQPPASAEQALEYFILPRYRAIQGLEILGQEPYQALAQKMFQEMGPQPNSPTINAFRCQLRYKIDQTTVLEQMEGGIIYKRTLRPSPYGASETVNWFTSGLVAFRCREDQFRQWGPTFRKMVDSIKPNPQWEAVYQRVSCQLNQQAQMQNAQITQAALERGRQMSQEHDRIFQMGRERMNSIDQACDAYRARSAHEDARQDERVRNIRGTDLYHDTVQGKDVELTSGYRQVWSNGNNEYILSDDVNYNPNIGGSGNWSQIDPNRQE